MVEKKQSGLQIQFYLHYIALKNNVNKVCMVTLQEDIKYQNSINFYNMNNNLRSKICTYIFVEIASS